MDPRPTLWQSLATSRSVRVSDVRQHESIFETKRPILANVCTC